jgi:hypothetical protein
MRRHQNPKLTRSIFRAFDVVIAFSLFVAFCVFVLNFRFGPIGAISIPLLAVFYGFSSLLYNRSRAYTRGHSRIRSLYAAERAMQATLFAVTGLLIGGGMYALFAWFGFTPGEEISKKHVALFAFIFPYAFIQAGLKCFLIALRVASVEFMRPLSPRLLRKRIGDGL